MPYAISRDGLRIHFKTGDAGTPVLLLHPNNANVQSWVDLGWFDALTVSGFRPIAIDARGFGESDGIETVAQIAAGTSTSDIEAVLAALDVDRVHVCGFSLGAAAALRFFADAPQRVRSLVLGGLGLGPLVQMGLFLGSSAEDARATALAQLDQVRSSDEAARRLWGLVRQVIASTPLARVRGENARAPVLGIAGETDGFAPMALYDQLGCAGLPVTVTELPGVGHGRCFTDSRFRDAAVRFMTAAAFESRV